MNFSGEYVWQNGFSVMGGGQVASHQYINDTDTVGFSSVAKGRLSPAHHYLSSAFGLPAEPEREDPLEQLLVRQTIDLGRLREVLSVCQVRVRICLQHVRPPLLVEPQIDSRVPIQVERTIRTLGHASDRRARRTDYR